MESGLKYFKIKQASFNDRFHPLCYLLDFKQVYFNLAEARFPHL